MKKGAVFAGFVAVMLVGFALTAQARTRVSIGVNIGVPVAPVGYYGYPAYPAYPYAAYPPVYYSGYYVPAYPTYVVPRYNNRNVYRYYDARSYKNGKRWVRDERKYNKGSKSRWRY